MLKHHMDNKKSDNTILFFILQLVCHIFYNIFAFNANQICMEILVVPNSYRKDTKHFE